MLVLLRVDQELKLPGLLEQDCCLFEPFLIGDLTAVQVRRRHLARFLEEVFFILEGVAIHYQLPDLLICLLVLLRGVLLIEGVGPHLKLRHQVVAGLCQIVRNQVFLFHSRL